MIYLDNSATTRPYEEVTALIAEEERLRFANASALYKPALEAEAGILAAKRQIASVLRCTPEEVLITTGGTYSNNLALFGACDARKRMGNRVVMSKVEHPSVYVCGDILMSRGFEVVYAEPTLASFEEAINDKTILVAAMLVNNETGLRLPVERIAGIIKRKKAPAHFHVDGVQAFGKIPTSVAALKCDSFSISAHKLKGPKGIGALYLKKGVRIKNILFGGEQEGGMVPGTYNSPAAAGFSKAIELYQKEDPAHFEALRRRFLERAAGLPFIQINSPADGVPYILNISCMGYLGENVLHFLEGKEIYVSQGSACSSKKARSGSVLGRLGHDEPTVMGALRISFGIENTLEEVDALMDALAEVPAKIQKLYKDV
ncbi:MAG: cysteine desulfurase [Clostridia bacterium]|nr:cysteine desulfurase [Clostridia bacterium]